MFRPVKKAWIPTGAVKLSALLTRMKANKKSFHDRMNA